MTSWHEPPRKRRRPVVIDTSEGFAMGALSGGRRRKRHRLTVPAAVVLTALAIAAVYGLSLLLYVLAVLIAA